MKKTASLLLALLLTISLVSCALSEDGSSSAPALAGPISSAVDSSVASDSSVPASSTDSTSSTTSSKPSSESRDPISSNPSTSSNPNTPSESPSHTITPINPDNYYGYSRLSKFQKQAYTKMLEAADGMPDAYIELGSPADLTERDVYLAAITLKNDHPEIFWLPYAWYIGETTGGQMAILFVNDTDDNAAGDIESFTATYTVKKSDKSSMQDELGAAVSEIKNKVTATDPYEIELQLHDILCEKVSYSKKPNPLSYTAYGALVSGDAVCEGYTRAMQLLLYEFGINSTTVTGFAGLQPHMWNLVELDSRWYHLDVTWNDSADGYRHEYFNLTDPGISKDHTLNSEFENLTAHDVLSGTPFNYKLPVCNATEYYYYSKTGYTYDKNPEKLADYIISSNASVIEIIGWDDTSVAAVSDALRKKNFTKTVHFEYDGGWAKVIIKSW